MEILFQYFAAISCLQMDFIHAFEAHFVGQPKSSIRAPPLCVTFRRSETKSSAVMFSYFVLDAPLVTSMFVSLDVSVNWPDIL